MLVARMPPGWFPPETYSLLCMLCRHICQSRWFGQCLQEVRAGSLGSEPEDLATVTELAKLHNLENRAAQLLMVRLRLTSQQQMPVERLARKKREAIPDDRPWQQ
jgi:hypothetical protein